MKWDETIASRCRYGDIAGLIWGDAEIIWEYSECDYQGSANILAKMPDGRFAHYEWTYGSCSGCDEWESRGLSDEEIKNEMERTTNWFDDIAILKKYLRLEISDAKIPTAQSPTAGSIPGMARWIFGGIGEEFKKMGEAFLEWENKQS